MNKKLFAILLSALMAISFAGCSTGNAQAKTQPEESSQNTIEATDTSLTETVEETEPEPIPEAEIIKAGPLRYADGIPMVLVPTTGDSKVANNKAYIDYSNSSEGYAVVNYYGHNHKVKLLISTPNGRTYTYTLNGGDEVFPFTEGNGTYNLTVYENISGQQYAAALSANVYVELRNEDLPFLYPNQYVWFEPDDNCVVVGSTLAKISEDELDLVSHIYNYVIDNMEYDYYKASTVKSGYTPDVDKIIDSGKGICFDYAAVMATMLRTQGIPTKMDVGYASTIYHAWISVYIQEVGWVNGIIEFNGDEWHLMDPTFADSERQSKAIMDFINNTRNYQIKYKY